MTTWFAQAQRVRTIGFMGDESGWIAASGYYTSLVVAGDYSRASWEGAALANWGSINPPLGKILLGFGVRAHPDYEARDSEFRGIYKFSHPLEWNTANGNVPFESTVVRARQVNAAFYAIAVALLFLAVVLHANALAGLGTAALVLTNDWIVAETTPALTDAYYFCFIFGLFCLGGALLGAESNGARRALFCSAGALAGAACSVKINGLPFAAAFMASIAVYGAVAKRAASWKEGGVCVAAFSTCALAIIYGLNPYFWPVDDWHSVFEFPRLYRRWPDLFAVQREQVPWPESGRSVEILRVLLTLFTPFRLERIVLGVGTATLLIKLVKSLRARRPDAQVVPLLFMATNVLFLLALMPVNYRRYYLPAVFAMKVAAAIGFSTGLVLVIRWGGQGIKYCLHRRQGARTSVRSGEGGS